MERELARSKAVSDRGEQRCGKADPYAERIQRALRVGPITVFEEKAETGEQADQHSDEQKYDERLQKHTTTRKGGVRSL